MNNDIDKNNTDNKSNNIINITKTQLLSSPPKSENSDRIDKENQKNSKTSEDSINDVEAKQSLNENEDWEVVDMDIDDDDDPIPNPNPDKNSDINTIIIDNKESNIKQGLYYYSSLLIYI